jgi:hypothetical protein
VELLLRDQEVLAAVLSRYTEYLIDVIRGFLLSVLANGTRVLAASSNTLCDPVAIIHPPPPPIRGCVASGIETVVQTAADKSDMTCG